MSRSRTLVVSIGIAAVALAGCTRPLRSWWPFAITNATVGAVAQVDQYLLAPIRDERGEISFFFPDSPDCRQVVVAEADVDYRQVGRLGRVVRDDVTCDPIGIASLAAWRDRRPRGGRGNVSVVPREPAFFRSFFSDADVILVRGRFLIAREIGWIGDDTVAMLPATCSERVASGNATVEFRASGPLPFRFVGTPDCAILGFARPIAARR